MRVFHNYRTVGRLLALGQTIEQIVEEMRMVAEGVATAESAHALATTCGVEMPITEQVHAVVNQGQTVREAMGALQARVPAEEWRD